MHEYRQEFDIYLGVKKTPNNHEKSLFARAQKHISHITWIPGIEMVAIVNSLSMFATHKDSDIDLFIIVKPGTIYLVRFLVTLTFWMLGVWRHGEDIAGNFCLSFFITTDAMNMEDIAIENDIYLYYWIYHMKPVFAQGDIYERFVNENNWVKIDAAQKQKNIQYILSIKGGAQTGLGRETVGVRGKSKYRGAGRTSAPFEAKQRLEMLLGCFSFPNTFGAFAIKSMEKLYLLCNVFIRFFLLRKTLKTYEKLGKPEGIMISDNILKFHDRDRRKEIREKIFQKNFDK